MSDKGIQSHDILCLHREYHDLEDRTYMRKKDTRVYEWIDFRMDVGFRERKRRNPYITDYNIQELK